MKIILIFLLSFVVATCVAQSTQMMFQSGHTQPITALSVSSNGKLTASGGADNAVLVWDNATGKIINRFQYHNNAIKALVFSPDNQFLLSAGFDKKIILYNLKKGIVEMVYIGHSKTISDLLFLPDGKRFVSASWDKTIKVWETFSGNELATLKVHTDYVNDILLTTNGKILISASDDRTLCFWNTDDYSNTLQSEPLESEIENIALSKDGKEIVCQLYNKSLITLSPTHLTKTIRTTKYALNMDLQPMTLKGVGFTKDGKHYFSAVDDNRVAFWKTESGVLDYTLKSDVGSMRWVTQMNFDILVSANGNIIQFWNLSNKSVERELKGIAAQITDIATTQDGKFLYVSATDGRIRCWNLKTGLGFYTYAFQNVGYRCMALASNSLTFASVDNHLILNPISDTAKFLKKNVGATFNALDFNNNNTEIISAGHDNKVTIFDAVDLSVKHTLTGHTQPVMQVKFSPDGKKAASCSWDKTIRIWDVTTGLATDTLMGHFGEVWSFVFADNGNTLISGGSDNKLIWWNLTTGKPIRQIDAHTDVIRCMSISPDGNTLATGSWDTRIKLWDVHTGVQLANIEANKSYIRTLRFTADGKWLISGNNEGQIKFYDAHTGLEKMMVQIFQKSNDFVITTPDGKFDGTQNGIANGLHYVQELNVIPLQSFYENFYTPDIWATVMNNETKVVKKDSLNTVKLPPIVKINNKFNGICEKRDIELEVALTDQGDGIDEVRLYLNGKLYDATNRSFKPIKKQNSEVIKKFNLVLNPGLNHIKVVAINNSRIESIPAELVLECKTTVDPQSDLYLFVVGMNKYKNAKYNLNYATSDASAFAETMKNGGKSIYKNIIEVDLFDSMMSKENFNKKMNEIINKAQQKDVFVFYFAGHGVMSESVNGIPSEFFLIPHNVTQMYTDVSELKKNAISAEELQNSCKQIKALKQLMILDACQSGGAVQAFTGRGVAEEKAIVQLARSSGIALLAASGSEQFATEFVALKHGVFTYAILEGLNGKADGGEKDSKITVNELKSYIEQTVPNLTEKYRGEAQYPTGYTQGQDFPLVITP